MDWGSYHPYSCHWYAIDYDGVMYVYRELYGYGGKANVGTKEPSTLVAQRIADAESTDKRLIRYAVLDNACWGKQDTGAPSIAEEINRVLMDNGCMMFNPSVKGREQAGEEIRLRLQGWEDKEGKRHPGIKIFNTCFHLIRTLPEITHDKNQPEKYDTNGEDHCIDDVGYACMSRPWKPIALKKQGKRDGWKFDYNNESNSRRSFMGV